MIKVEPDLPKPTAEPATFLAGSSDGLFVERGLASRCVEVDDAEQAGLWGEDVVDAIEEGIKVGDLGRRGYFGARREEKHVPWKASS